MLSPRFLCRLRFTVGIGFRYLGKTLNPHLCSEPNKTHRLNLFFKIRVVSCRSLVSPLFQMYQPVDVPCSYVFAGNVSVVPVACSFIRFNTSAFAPVFPLSRKIQSILHMACGLSVTCYRLAFPLGFYPEAYLLNVRLCLSVARVRFLCLSVSKNYVDFAKSSAKIRTIF